MYCENVLRLAVLAGEIMLQSGAETYRIEDTMQRIIKNYGYKNSDSVVTSTGITSSIDSPEGIKTLAKRITSRSTDLNKVCLVNQFSRDINMYKDNIDEAFKKLREIDSLPGYRDKFKTIASAFSCFGFSLMFGANYKEAIASAIIGFLSYSVVVFYTKYNISRVIVNLLTGVLIGLLAILANLFGFNDNMHIIVVGSIMPYVPGLLLTNAIRDVLVGDFLSGTARLSDAVIISVAIATGVGSILSLWISFFGGSF